jgi:nucleotide-binding universal stress UspA family protein
VFERILVPLDGSEHSQRALETAIEIAKKFSSHIVLLHVYSVTVTPVIVPEPTTVTPAGVPVATSAEVAKMVDAARDFGREILAEGKRKVQDEGIEADTVLREGNSAQEIVKLAREGQFGLVVVGARGIHKIREILMGSVSEGVAKNAPCPVLVVK